MAPTMHEKRPKIIATIWKKPFNRDRVASIIHAGTDGLRVKCSHESPDDIIRAFEQAKALIAELGTSTELLADLPDTKLRLGQFSSDKRSVVAGRRYRLVPKSLWIDQSDTFPLATDAPIQRIAQGHRLIIGDGIGFFIVRELMPDGALTIEAENDAIVTRQSSITLPNDPAPDGQDQLTPELWAMVEQLRSIRPDFLAFSFVDSGAMMHQIQTKVDELTSHDWRPRLVAKIENQRGLTNVHEIAQVADLIMVARGDLTLTAPIERLALNQQAICQSAREAGTSVIVATGLLDSLEQSPFPSRADVIDVATAVRDGADYLMLCRVTAHSANPAVAVQMAKRIADAVA